MLDRSWINSVCLHFRIVKGYNQSYPIDLYTGLWATCFKLSADLFDLHEIYRVLKRLICMRFGGLTGKLPNNLINFWLFLGHFVHIMSLQSSSQTIFTLKCSFSSLFFEETGWRGKAKDKTEKAARDPILEHTHVGSIFWGTNLLEGCQQVCGRLSSYCGEACRVWWREEGVFGPGSRQWHEER